MQPGRDGRPCRPWGVSGDGGSNHPRGRGCAPARRRLGAAARRITAADARTDPARRRAEGPSAPYLATRSEEHTSELQSQSNLVCRLLLEKKNNTRTSVRVLTL